MVIQSALSFAVPSRTKTVGTLRGREVISRLLRHTGNTPGIVQPNSKAQADLMRATYAAAGLDGQHTQYFEAHGTGTTLGDPLEVSALVKALETKRRAPTDPLFIGVSDLES